MPFQVIGQNVIGIMEGKNSKSEVIVIAADYDTPISGDPFKNNAGGVAVLLETSRLFKQTVKSPTTKLDQTVIFVAFDLNTKEYVRILSWIILKAGLYDETFMIIVSRYVSRHNILMY